MIYCRQVRIEKSKVFVDPDRYPYSFGIFCHHSVYIIIIHFDQLQTKRQKIEQENVHTRCENCHCYKCCRHVWICGECGIKRDYFFKLLNQDRQEDASIT